MRLSIIKLRLVLQLGEFFFVYIIFIVETQNMVIRIKMRYNNIDFGIF
jgi:hypothetical protein